MPRPPRSIAAADRLAALGTEETALQGTLRVDLAETLLCYALDEVIAAFRERAPGVALRLRDRTCAQVSENLRDGSCDLGLTYAFDWQPEDFSIEEVGQIRTTLVAAPSIPLPDFQSAGQLAGLPFIIDEPDNVFRIALERTLDARGVMLAETMELWSSQAIKRLVSMGMGFSVFPASPSPTSWRAEPSSRFPTPSESAPSPSTSAIARPTGSPRPPACSAISYASA